MMNLQTKLYKPIIKNGDYLFSDKLKFPFPVEIHFTRMEEFESMDSFKVLVLSNESYMSPNRSTINDVIDNHKKYDLILCVDDEIVAFCRNAYRFPYGSTWLNRGDIEHPDGLGRYKEGIGIFEPQKKEFGISFLASWYNIDRPGYLLRHQVWDRRDEIKLPTNFYSSTKCFVDGPNPLPGAEKDPLFDTQYHICIENQPIGNYFTEIEFFESDMTLVTGSNGHGKSYALLDSITFGLFGKPFRKINIPQLVNTVNKKQCIVEVYFKIGSVQSKVIRGLAPKVFEIYKDDL